MTDIIVPYRKLTDIADTLLALYEQVTELAGETPITYALYATDDMADVDNLTAHDAQVHWARMNRDARHAASPPVVAMDGTGITWHTVPGNIPGHVIYCDDPRGREHCRYLITPLRSRYVVQYCDDDNCVELGRAKSLTAAKALAEGHAG
jgi:hypothetical protein